MGKSSFDAAPFFCFCYFSWSQFPKVNFLLNASLLKLFRFVLFHQNVQFSISHREFRFGIQHGTKIKEVFEEDNSPETFIECYSRNAMASIQKIWEGEHTKIEKAKVNRARKSNQSVVNHKIDWFSFSFDLFL